MSMDVVMPQMGESVAEGTITKWLKQVGDPVKRDEPLFEISTDKVDAEIPSPVAGELLEILHGEGETIEVNTIVARIAATGEVGGAPGDGDGARGASDGNGGGPVAAEPAAPRNQRRLLRGTIKRPSCALRHSRTRWAQGQVMPDGPPGVRL